MTNFTKSQLAALLQEAAEAHHVFEQSLGKRDEDWHEWYAEYILRKLNQINA